MTEFEFEKELEQHHARQDKMFTTSVAHRRVCDAREKMLTASQELVHAEEILKKRLAELDL